MRAAREWPLDHLRVIKGKARKWSDDFSVKRYLEAFGLAIRPASGGIVTEGDDDDPDRTTEDGDQDVHEQDEEGAVPLVSRDERGVGDVRGEPLDRLLVRMDRSPGFRAGWRRWSWRTGIWHGA